MCRVAGAGLALLVAACAHEEQELRAEAPAGPVVVGVTLVGNRTVPAEELSGGLATRSAGAWPWSDEARLDPLAVEADERRIRTALAARGFFDAQVDSRVLPAGPDEVRVEFLVDERERSVVTELHVSGVERLPARERRALLATIGEVVVPGRPLLVGAFESLRPRLVTQLWERGYAGARVGQRADAYPDRRAVVVRVDVRAGGYVAYGDIRVEGVAALPAEPIAAIVRRALPLGDRYRPSAVEDARRRLLATGVLATVAITLDPADEDGIAPVLVTVSEIPVHTLAARAGVSVDRNLQQIELGVRYRNTNALGGLRRFSADTTGALAFLPRFFDASRVGLTGDLAFELVQPELLSRIDGAVRASYLRIFRQAYESNALSLRLAASSFPSRALRIVPSLLFLRYVNFSPHPLAPGPLPLTVDCPAPCALPGLELAVTYDGRDDPISPRRGTYLLLDAHYVAPTLGGDYHLVRFLPEARAYLPIGDLLVLAARARIGEVVSIGGSDRPIVERLMSGGEGGHRGFAVNQLSPLAQDTSGAFIPIGGNGLWLATIELRVRLAEQWGVALFADYGDVTVDSWDLALGDGQLALGIGPRYYSVAGPIRLDLGYRIAGPVRRALNTGVAAPSGGLDSLALTFSLGEAF